MTQRLFIFLLIFTVLGSCITVTSQEIPMKKAVADQPLQLKISTVSNGMYTTTNIPVTISFRNTGSKAIRIIDEYTQTSALPAFFSLELRNGDGTPVLAYGGGKIDFGPAPVKYVALRPGQQHDVKLNLNSFVPAQTRMSPGRYSISLVYHNQYGVDCFKGSLSSNAIQVTLFESQ